jgi:hypothetical protein
MAKSPVAKEPANKPITAFNCQWLVRDAEGDEELVRVLEEITAEQWIVQEIFAWPLHPFKIVAWRVEL